MAAVQSHLVKGCQTELVEVVLKIHNFNIGFDKLNLTVFFLTNAQGLRWTERCIYVYAFAAGNYAYT